MIRTLIKHALGHAQMQFTTQSSRERDDWQNVFPRRVPPGHGLTYAWSPDGTQLVFTLAPLAEGEPAPGPQGTVGETRHETVDAEWAAERERLNKLDVPTLITVGAELGVKLVRSKHKPEQMVAEILIAKRKRAAEQLPAAK